MLLQIFVSNIPESFLPYPKNKIDEALSIIEENQEKSGKKEHAKAIKNTHAYLGYYIKDEKAFDELIENLKIPQMRDAIISNIKTFQKDWTYWHNQTKDELK